MNRTKIEWTDYTWNPVVGCKNNCWYCYGKSFSQRFRKIPFKKITVHPERFQEPAKIVTPSKIFVGSMTDLFAMWANPIHVINILSIVSLIPYHIFQFLTKNPQNYSMFKFPSNCWLGLTLTGKEPLDFQISKVKSLLSLKNITVKFISLEPLLSLPIYQALIHADWVIVGALTGPYADKHRPKPEWIKEIIAICNQAKTPLFIKENIKWRKRIQKFPLD